MKLNWGTGIVIGIGLFIAFIMFLVLTMTLDDKYSHDLVTEEYYKKEMVFQQEMDARENMKQWSSGMGGVKVVNGWLLSFPEEVDPQKVRGTVFLYRPSNKQLDFDFPIELSNSDLLIPDNRLLDGRWNITVDWEYEGEKYLFKEEIEY